MKFKKNLIIMKKLYLICFILTLFASNLISQKVKYKKDKIFVDKVEKYDFIRTKKGGLTSLSHFILKEINGTEVLIVTDTLLTLAKLPFEKEPKVYENLYLYIAPQINKREMIPPMMFFNQRKHIKKRLKKFDFFKTGIMTDEIFNLLITKYYDTNKLKNLLIEFDSINTVRLENYNATEEKFGAPNTRDPNWGILHVSEKSEVFEGGKIVGHFRSDKNSSKVSSYLIQNSNKKVIGVLRVFKKKNKLVIITHVNHVEKTLKLDLKFNADNMTKYFELTSEYLINYGYL